MSIDWSKRSAKQTSHVQCYVTGCTEPVAWLTWDVWTRPAPPVFTGRHSCRQHRLKHSRRVIFGANKDRVSHVVVSKPALRCEVLGCTNPQYKSNPLCEYHWLLGTLK